MDPIVDYLQKDVAPNNLREARKLRKGVSKYVMVSQQLYMQGFSYPLLKCLHMKEAKYIIKEVHEGICRTHIGGKALTSKIARARYYWLTLKKDCTNFVKRYDKCLQFRDLHRASPKLLHLITSPWPFCMWGVDILGLFPPIAGQVKFFIVVVEAKPVATISIE
ncbi:hypothetical protein CR513_26975, partial [Mucuna pruriens]